MRLQLSCFNSELLFLMVAVELVPRYYFFNLCKIQFCRECHLRGTWNLSAAGDYESLSMLCRKAHPCSDGTRLAPGWHQSAALQRDWQRWLVSHWKCASCLLRCLQVPYQKGFGGFHFFSVRHIFFFTIYPNTTWNLIFPDLVQIRFSLNSRDLNPEVPLTFDQHSSQILVNTNIKTNGLCSLNR